MDLFGRKARLELEKVLGDNAALLMLIEGASDIVAQKDRQIQARKLEIAELRGKLEIALAPPMVPPISSQPLYLNEQQEDIEYAFKNELIDKEVYEDMLRQLEFDNTSIEIEYS